MTDDEFALQRAAETAIHQCLALDSDESIAIIYDHQTVSIAEALYDVAGEVTNERAIVRYPEGETHGGEPPDPVAGAMSSGDTFLAPTSKSLSHTRARQHASEAGARGATLPGITETVFIRGLDADYDQIAANCTSIHRAVADAESIAVRTDAGTDLRVSPGDRRWLTDTGIIHEPGDFSNLPAGEVFISPADANGTVVIDGTMRPYGLLDEPIEVQIDDGYVTAISDDAIREMVEDAAAEVGDAAYNVAELGIGANTGVTDLVGSVLLDEKAAGTIHVAIGDDASIGGDTEAPIHLDGVVRNPEVLADGRRVELPVAP